MPDTFNEFLQIDLPALILALLAALCCALLGSFLVLRKQAMIGDSLSHSVLPGLAAGFILSGSVHPAFMITGALASSLLSIIMLQLIQKYARIEPGAAMGITFTTLFALGLVMLETSVGSNVHLDAHHALYGALELTYWQTPGDFSTLPYQISVLALTALIILLFIMISFKELTLTSFDAPFANLAGFKTTWVNAAFLFVTALCIVACFDALGSILVVALIVCPPAAARMYCDTLPSQLRLASIFGVASAVLGYALAAWLPLWLGFEQSLNASGMIALTAGAIQLYAMLTAPKYGVLKRKTAKSLS